MNYADILVKLDPMNHETDLLDLGIDLCLDFKAHLNVICPVQSLASLPYAGMAAHREILESYMNDLRSDVEKLESDCRKLADKRLIKMTWSAPTGLSDDIVTEFGRLSDLVILAQGNTTKFQSVLQGLSDELLITMGRPTLIVPFIGFDKIPFKRVLIAWDGSRSSARAINDALPFLHRAEHIEVTTIFEASKGATQSSHNNENICAHLLHHGIGAESTSLAHKDINIGNTLLNHISDTGADLLVMGAYGHSRVRETLLGGVTKLVLRSMTVPVLMSH